MVAAAGLVAAAAGLGVVAVGLGVAAATVEDLEAGVAVWEEEEVREQTVHTLVCHTTVLL